MADNNNEQQSQVKHNRDLALGRATATEPADDETRSDMNEGSNTGTQAAQGTAALYLRQLPSPIL